MGFWRSLFAVVVATVVAFLLGVAFDYFRMAMRYQTEGLLMVFPAVSAAAGFLAALIALGIAGGGGAARGRTAAGSPQKRQAGQTGKAGEVPGMPTFDFDRAGKSVKDAEKEK